ncbi:MAG: restriction endonuclease subunit S [Butyrivibrio sp.]
MAMMKSSNTEWLGDIPAEWDVAQIGNYYELRNEKVSDYDFEPLSVTMNGIVPQLATAAKSDDHSNRKLVKKGDFVINSRSDRRGSCGISPLDGSVSLINTVMEPRGEMNPQYYNWLFHTEQFADEFYKWGHGIVNDLWTTRWQEMKKILIVAPSPDEQQAIADYLDKTCSQIDEIIAEAKASIDEYKDLKQSVIDKAVLHGLSNGMMKDSENDLIGKIPLSWEMRKLKYVADFNPSITVAYDVQKEVGYVPMNCVKNGYMNPLSARLFDMSTGLTGFQNGDIVIAKVTPCFENGNIAIAENLEQGVAFGSSELFVIRTHSINRRFMLYYLQNSVFKNQCISTMTGTGGLKRVSGYFVNNAYITYPPENEQQVIVDYLDETVKNMDSLIAEKESLINDLEAYKKSLIYEVVTGKRRVV